MSRLGAALSAGLVIGLVGGGAALTPAGWNVERSFGLDWLYAARGATVPPPDVMVVGVDLRSAHRLGLPASLVQWPRTVHACLIDRLTAAGATVLAFDVFFGDESDPDGARSRAGGLASRRHPQVDACMREHRDRDPDAVLADAMRRSGSVVLLQRLRATRSSRGLEEELRSPTPELADAALGLAPWVLPQYPVRVDSYWTFKTSLGHRATLPTLALAAHLSDQRAPALHESVARTRGAFADAAGEFAIGAARGALPPRLVPIYAGADGRFVNYYGPSGSIPTVSYADAFFDLAPDGGRSIDFAGKAVFIGASRPGEPQTVDGYYTVFRQENGADASGVEIAATAFANLLTGNEVLPPNRLAILGILAGLGFVLGALACGLPVSLSVVGALAIAGAYFATAAVLFSRTGIWLPVALPLLLQLPLALAAGALAHYLGARRAIGYYVPHGMVGRLLAHGGEARGPELVHGCCMSTDIADFTSLSERLPPAALAALLNEYFAEIGHPIHARGGALLDIVGDGSMSAWTSPGPDRRVREQACVAALEVLQGVAAFNVRHRGLPLTTRIGLDAGWFVIGNVGSREHLAYSVVGDTANTSSRIQNLNKYLGTSVLASAGTVSELSSLLCRPVGRYRLVGKDDAVLVYEILGLRDSATPRDRDRCGRFQDAFERYEAADWVGARAAFADVLRAYPGDAPARFLLGRCDALSSQGAADTAPDIIEMSAK